MAGVGTTKKTDLTSTPSYQFIKGDAAYGLSTEFEDDNPVRMPSPTDDALIAAAKLRQDIMGRSGRTSTDLTGTRVYSNVFLGSA